MLLKFLRSALAFGLILALHGDQIHGERSFTVDYEKDQFLLDGSPFRYVAGDLHYFRVPHQYWFDRLSKMRSAGVNVVQTYIEWSTHETTEGNYRFNGDQNVTKFLDEAQRAGLLVLLRLGPYICSERDMGGLPWWLLRYNVQLRRNDEIYMKYLRKWFSVLLPKIKAYLYQNGGPIIMAQIENEYGYYSACDYKYMSNLRDIVQSHWGNDTVLYTVDGPSALKCGLVDGTLGTIDFGTGQNPEGPFNTLRTHRASGPLVNSEFWVGKIDTWGLPRQPRIVGEITKWLDTLLAYKNMSVGLYMFHGGTNFGLLSGANSGEFLPKTTSYDEDAPLDESGEPTQKYYAIRTIIKKHLPVPKMRKFRSRPKLSLGPLEVDVAVTFPELFTHPSWKKEQSNDPQAFEYLGARNGIVLYSTNITFKPTSPSLLTISELRDRGYIFVDKIYQGIVSRQEKAMTIPIRAKKGSRLDIIVENQGRIYYGDNISQHKGIFGSVKLGSKTLNDWSHYYINDWEDAASGHGILNISRSLTTRGVKDLDSRGMSLHPAVLRTEFTLPPSASLMDTFLNPSNMTKGFAYINGRGLGRYWPGNGPQVTLYTPGVWLHPYPAKNELILVELEDTPCLSTGSCFVSFVDKAVLDGETPTNW